MPGRRSTSARRPATSCSCRPLTPSWPASRQPRPDGRRAPEPAPRQPPAARPSDVGRPVCRAGGQPRAPGRIAPARRSQLLALRSGAGRCDLSRRRHPARRAARRRSARPGVAGWSTLPAEACHRLWQYLVHGGLDNAGQFLAYAAALLGSDEPWREPAPLMRAGLYWPGWRSPISRRCKGIGSRTERSRPWCSIGLWSRQATWRSSIADRGARQRTVERVADLHRQPQGPDRCAAGPRPAAAGASIVLNATGFAVSAPGAWRPTPLDEPDRCVLQVVLAGGSEAAWRAGTRGLSARDLAMNVALPELDGRVLSRAVAFKTRRRFDPATESNIVGFAPAPTGCLHRGAGSGLGAPGRHAGGRAAGRDRARQLSQPRRPDRQRRRSRHAGEHHGPARGDAGGGLSDRRSAG